MDSLHKDTEVKYTESPKYQCLEFLRKNSVELYRAYLRHCRPEGISSALCSKRKRHLYSKWKDQGT